MCACVPVCMFMFVRVCVCVCVCVFVWVCVKDIEREWQLVCVLMYVCKRYILGVCVSESLRERVFLWREDGYRVPMESL